MNTAIPWMTEPPTLEQVKAHAAAHPAKLLPGETLAGLWLARSTDPGAIPHFVVVTVDCGNHINMRGNVMHGDIMRLIRGARWLPCAADGVPVAMEEMAERIDDLRMEAWERSERD